MGGVRSVKSKKTGGISKNGWLRLRRKCHRNIYVILSLLCFFLAAKQIVVIHSLYEKRTVCVEMEEQCTTKEVLGLLDEATCFPVAKRGGHKKESAQNFAKAYYYENGYGTERTYGGKRQHEGIDIISTINEIGILQICSVTDGVVERIGWNRLGGYRVGIRSENGYYYYYAHLDSYEPGLQEGDKVLAGQKLGIMGNSGYGEEGTKGKFVVHLHFGIYQKKGGEEVSVNPYYILKYMEKN